MKGKLILDPLWITKGNYLDSEYFNYILLDATQKYKQELEEDNIDRFDEILFHILNLNNLAVNGSIFNQKLKRIFDDTRVNTIRENLKHLYNLDEETTDIFRNANYVFLNILFDYMNIQLDILENIKLFHVNPKIHQEKEIFIILNTKGKLTYKIWRLLEDPKKNFGYSFSQIKTVKLEELKDNALYEEIVKSNDAKLKAIAANTNLCYVIVEDVREDLVKVAKVVKDTLILNKGIAKSLDFEPKIIQELYKLLWLEKVMPFTLDQWVSQEG